MPGSSPKNPGDVERAALLTCIQACADCAQACTACADACLSEDMVAEMAGCIRTDLNCADICEATARVQTRHTSSTAAVTAPVVRA